jgi:hypothetical protein
MHPSDVPPTRTDAINANSFIGPAHPLFPTALRQPPPPALVIHDDERKPMVTVHPDGRVELHQADRADEAARTFWKAIEAYGVPARAGVCGTCKHWSGGAQGDMEYGNCEAAGDSDDYTDRGPILTTASHGGGSFLQTRREFGCLLHEL